MNEVNELNELVDLRSPEVIATEINTIKQQTQNIVLEASIEIGKRLNEAKEKVEHGEWENWLKENVDYSKRTAQNLMKIHDEYGDENTQAPAYLNYTKAVALLGVEADEREEILEKNDVEKMSTRELDKLVKEKKELEKKLKEKEDEFDQKEDELQSDLERLEEQLNELEKSDGSDEIEAEKEKIEKEMAKLQEEAEKRESRITQLEAELKEKPEPKTETIEVIPEEVKKELEELRNKTKGNKDESDIKFKVEFDQLVKSFNDTIEAVEEVNNQENRKKYKSAIKKVMERMGELLEEVNTSSAPEGQTIIDEFV